jgi:hypothetical protein
MFSASFSVGTIIEIDGVDADMFLRLVERQRPNVQSIQNRESIPDVEHSDLDQFRYDQTASEAIR